MKTIRYIIAALYCLAYMLLADTVTLAWDANPEPNLFYRVSYGLASGQHVTDLPLVTGTETTTPLLLPGTTYYFIVRAVNSKGLMSPPSNEAGIRIPSGTHSGGTEPPRPPCRISSRWT
jgi:Fibronectin type III domain